MNIENFVLGRLVPNVSDLTIYDKHKLEWQRSFQNFSLSRLIHKLKLDRPIGEFLDNAAVPHLAFGVIADLNKIIGSF